MQVRRDDGLGVLAEISVGSCPANTSAAFAGCIVALSPGFADRLPIVADDIALLSVRPIVRATRVDPPGDQDFVSLSPTAVKRIERIVTAPTLEANC